MGLIKIAKGLKNHWKKSTFAAGALAYGISYASTKFEISRVMRAYCEEAVKYGDVSQNVTSSPKKIVVILNPAANKKSAEKKFEKYCEPILHLAGYLVDIVRTDSEGHARRYVEELENLPDAILVAGGDGTLSETITGLMRRGNHKKCPVGILPVGRTNSTAANYFSLPTNPNGVQEVRGLVDTAIAVVRGKLHKKDIMKVQPISEPDQEQPQETPKPIFALGSLHWGAFRDAKSLQDKYWYVGPFREYAAILFNAFSNELTWNCRASLTYTDPCPGCRNCYVEELKIQQVQRWWSRFVPRFKLGHQSSPTTDYSKILNENCSMEKTVEVNSTEFILSPENNNNGISKLSLELQDPIESGFDFISQSWKRIKTGQVTIEKALEGRTIKLIPETNLPDGKAFYSIDNEAFDVRPVKVSIVPKAIDVFVL